MTSITNKLVNASGQTVWCAYSSPAPNGGEWDVWRVRLIQAGNTSAWKVDIDYIKPQNANVTINGRAGWWKLGQGGSFYIATDQGNSNNLLVLATGGLIASVRHYEDWARGKNRAWYERSTPKGEAEIAGQLAESLLSG